MLRRVEGLHVDADEATAGILEQRPGAGGEIGEARTDAEDHVRFACQRVGGARARDPECAHRQRMVGRDRRFTRLRLGDGHSPSRAEVDQLALGVGIEDAAAADDERLLARRQEIDCDGDLVRVRRDPPLAIHPLLEKRSWIVIGFRLDVLAEGERHRPAIGRIGQDGKRARQRRHDLLGTRDAIEIARHRPEAVVRARRPVAEVFDLLQHRIGLPIGENVAGDQQHRQAIDVRDRCRCDHVGRAGADRGRAGHHAPAARSLGEGDRGMRHRLLVMCAVGRELIAGGIERFSEARYIAVAEDCEHTLEEPLRAAVDFHPLSAEEADHSLRGCQSDRFHHVGVPLQSFMRVARGAGAARGRIRADGRPDKRLWRRGGAPDRHRRRRRRGRLPTAQKKTR
jgi:hypothetical protein